MLEPALATAQSWDAQVRSFAPARGQRLAHEEEVFLFRVHARLTGWLDELAREPPAIDDEGADRRRTGVRYLEVLRTTVRTTLVNANRGLAHSEAWAAFGRARAARRPMVAMGMDDLVQEGLIGLMVAIDGFDWRRGLRFSTYAVPVIRRRIDRAIVEKEPLIYLPEHAVTCLGRVRDFGVQFREAHGRSPSPEEISAATGVSRETLASIYAAGRRVAEPESDGEVAAHSTAALPDPDAIDALRVLVSQEVERVVQAAIASLDGIEQNVLRHRFGLAGCPELSQAEIGERVGLSQQRIVQIESRALLKLLIAARQQGHEAPGNGTLDALLASLAEYDIAETDGLCILSRWLRMSDRFRTPAYVRTRLLRLERLGLSKPEIGRRLALDPASIGGNSSP